MMQPERFRLQAWKLVIVSIVVGAAGFWLGGAFHAGINTSAPIHIQVNRPGYMGGSCWATIYPFFGDGIEKSSIGQDSIYYGDSGTCSGGTPLPLP
jgi:hypothetical protein